MTLYMLCYSGHKRNKAKIKSILSSKIILCSEIASLVVADNIKE